MAEPVADLIPLSGDPYVDGLIQGSTWQFAGATVLTYSFNITPYGGAWDAAWSAAVEGALAAWSNVANVSFSELDSGLYYYESSADIAVSLTGDFLQYYMGAVAFGVFPDPYFGDIMLDIVGSDRDSYPQPEGDLFFDDTFIAYDYLQPGGSGFAFIMHEIGHALGLKHPFDDGGNERPTYAELGIGEYDDGLWTVMSYNDPSTNFISGYQATPMPLDILAIQAIYGANMSYHTGDDSYALAESWMVSTIWDAGGHDTIDASGSTVAVAIDLAPGAFSQAGGTWLAIAYDVSIEAATGSAYDDLLAGNDAGNVLYGGDGNDRLDGGAGDDFLQGNLGVDVLEGNAGDDTVRGGKDSDDVDGESDDDMVYGDRADDVVHGGDGNDLVRGGKDSDLVYGDAGNDTLMGDKGNDTLEGGDGADVFQFASGSGVDVIDDFNLAADLIALEAGLNGGGIHAAVDVLAHASDTAEGAVIDLGSGHSVLLQNVSASQLTQDMFLII
jgi:serralysin